MPGTRSEIGDLWRSVNREMHDRFRQAFRGCDLPFGALIFLRIIKEHPGVTVGELARNSGFAKSQVSKMIAHLVEQGFAEKRADPADQRLVRIYTTPNAEQTTAGMEERAQAAWSAVMDEVPEAQLADVARGLRILLEALKSVNIKKPIGEYDHD